MKKLTIAYLGSPYFSANFLEKILTDKTLTDLLDISFVITQPDKLSGRERVLTPTPVKEIAEKYNIKVETTLPQTKDRYHIDVALVYAYAGIIPDHLLDLPKLGFWCIHPSLLPKYRGSSPIATALINGDETTGVTIIKMDEKIDHGPIIAQQSLTIKKYWLRPDLEKELTDLSFEMFLDLIKNRDVKKIFPLKEQDHKQATYTKKLNKQDGFINLEKLKIPYSVYNLYRGLYSWPGIWTALPDGKRLKITEMKLVDDTKLAITKVQLEGKKEVDFNTFNRAYRIF